MLNFYDVIVYIPRIITEFYACNNYIMYGMPMGLRVEYIPHYTPKINNSVVGVKSYTYLFLYGYQWHSQKGDLWGCSTLTIIVKLLYIIWCFTTKF